MTMNEPQEPHGPRRGRTKKGKAEGHDPLAHGEPDDAGDDAPVDLESLPEHRVALHEAGPAASGPHRDDLDLYRGDRPVEWDYDEESELEPDYDEESEFEPDYDEEDELEPDYDDESEFEPGEGPGHGPHPRLAPGPKHGPGHHPGPPHEHGPGPKKAPGKKAPGKKVPGKKAPGKKVPGAKKHPGHPPPPPHEHGPGHPPPPPHEHGPGHGRDEPGPEPDFGLGPGTGFGFGPGLGFGLGFGPGARSRRRGSGRARRVRPGDVRAAILTLLTEGPMHGYEMIQQIAERTRDLWRPSPGSVYPTLQLLDDEGLIASSESEGSTKLFELTDQGRRAAEKIKTPPWEQFREGVDSDQDNLRTALAQLSGAVAQAAYATTAEIQQRVLTILKNARREIYTLLAQSE